MYNVTAVKKDNRMVSMLFTGVTSVTDSSSNKVITVGGVTITIVAADWDLFILQSIPAT